MSAYQLEATDGSGSHSVPAGETVVGRGPLLGIADKRVSRSHAVLEVVDDQLRIKGMHVNPCFYQASGKSMFAPLERNEWCWLHSGDCISLLPDKYSFRIIANNSSEEATLRNSQELDEETGLNDNSNSPITSETKAASSPQHGPSSLTVTSNTRNNGKIRNNVPSSAVVESPKPAQRKRVLPNWMLQGDLPVQALPSHVITAGKKKRTVTQRTQTTSSLKSKDKDIPEEKQSEVSFPSTSSSLTRTATPVNLQKGLVVDNEEDDMKEEHCDDTPKLSTPPPSNSSPSGSPSTSNNKSSVAKADNNDNISLSPVSPQQNTQQAPKKRFPCMYGDQCYRKNPTHFQEFSHPGDSDYYDAENGSQDDNDDRPECPYGTDCYRKNPQHKLEYKHTRPPGRKLRKRNPKKAKRSVLDGDSDDDGETNDYDLEDSFIDEDEDFDITDEDSDWMPDSEDKDSEDVKELLKEAKKFVRGKR